MEIIVTIRKQIATGGREKILLTIPEVKILELQEIYHLNKRYVEVWIELKKWISSITQQDQKYIVVSDIKKILKEIINYKFQFFKSNSDTLTLSIDDYLYDDAFTY